jgi:hypothetical protein
MFHPLGQLLRRHTIAATKPPLSTAEVAGIEFPIIGNATGMPVRRLATRTRAILLLCSSWSPWAMLNLATFMPDCRRRESVSTSSVEGPSVQTMRVFRKVAIVGVHWKRVNRGALSRRPARLLQHRAQPRNPPQDTVRRGEENSRWPCTRRDGIRVCRRPGSSEPDRGGHCRYGRTRSLRCRRAQSSLDKTIGPCVHPGERRRR